MSNISKDFIYYGQEGGKSPPEPARGKSYEVVDLNDLSTQAATSGAKYYGRCVAYYVLKFLAFLFYIPLKVITFIPNAVSYFYNRDLNQDILTARLTALKEGLRIPLTGKVKGQDIQSKAFEEWSYQDLRSIGFTRYTPKGIDEEDRVDAIDDFLEMVDEIHGMILDEEDPDDIRAKIDSAMSTDVYQQLKAEEGNPAIDLLQVLAMKDLSTKGEEAFKNYGKKVLGDLGKESLTWGELADQMDTPIHATFAYHRNGKIATTLWAMAHPFEALYCMEASWFPMQFNGHQSNPNIRGFDFTMEADGKRKSMQFYYGPGPTGDRLYHDGVLVYMDKLNRKGAEVHELRQNFQNMKQGSEALRIYEMARYEEAHPDSMRLLSMSFDTEAMDMEAPFMQFNTPIEFMLLYSKYAMAKEGLADPSRTIGAIEPWAHNKMLKDHKEDNGIFVCEKTISDGGLKQAFKCAEDVFATLHARGNAHWDELMKSDKGKARLGRMMQLGTQGIISLGAVCQSLRDMDSVEDVRRKIDEKLDADLAASRVSGACKQDIDRAIVENVTLRLFFRLLTSDAPLTQDEVYSIAGAVIGRARIVEGRLIQWKRYEVLSDLLHFVNDQENVTILADKLKDFRDGRY